MRPAGRDGSPPAARMAAIACRRPGPSGLRGRGNLLTGLFLILATLVCPSQAAPAASGELEDLQKRIQQQKRDLDALRRELEEGRRKVARMESEAKSAAEALGQVEENLRLEEEMVARLDSTESEYRRLLSASENRLGTARDALARRRELLAHRVRDIYMHGRPRPGLAWLGQSDYDTFRRRHAAFRSIVREDRRLLGLVRDRQAALERETQAHRTRIAGLAEIKRQKSDEVGRLSETRAERERRLAELEASARDERAELEKLRASQEALEKIIARLEQRRRDAEAEDRRRREQAEKRGAPPPPPRKEPIEPAGPPPARAGMCWPIRGRILSSFGLHTNPVLGTTTRNLGIEIAGTAGMPVTAASGGRVAAVTRLPGRGTTIILEHPGGYFSVYGHLRRVLVSEGRSVTACSPIAEVGNEESFDGYKLYFELRRGMTALDPVDWLAR